MSLDWIVANAAISSPMSIPGVYHRTDALMVPAGDKVHALDTHSVAFRSETEDHGHLAGRSVRQETVRIRSILVDGVDQSYTCN